MFRITGRLQEEREAAEDRSRKIQERVLHFSLESRVSELNEKLAQAQKQLHEQQEASEGLIQQMAMERDESRSQLSEAEARATSLEQELATISQTLWQEKKAAEALVHQLQDERRTQLSGFESHLQNLEELLALAQRQFQDQREAVIRMIQRRAAGKD